MFKKLLVIMLAICLIFSMSGISYAETTDISIAEGLLQSALLDPYATLEGGIYSMSESIPSYSLKNGVVSSFNEAEYHIVFCDSNPVAIFTVNAINSNSPTYTFG